MRHFAIDKIQLTLTDEVLKILANHIQDDSRKNEAGGIILGQISDTEVRILKASTPNKFDKASRYNFVRDKDAAQVIADFEYLNSNKETIYFGEWHTHPEEDPTPSLQDIKMIKEQFKLGKNFPQFIFLIIQGTKGLYVGVCNKKDLLQMVEV